MPNLSFFDAEPEPASALTPGATVRRAPDEYVPTCIDCDKPFAACQCDPCQHDHSQIEECVACGRGELGTEVLSDPCD